MTSKVFDKHLNELATDYKFVIFINLLQKARSYEDALTQSLEKQFKENQSKSVKYTYYDFHSETKGDVTNTINYQVVTNLFRISID